MVNVHDVEELNNRLLSSTNKVREEGLKNLISYLEMEDFASLLDNQTAEARLQDRISPATWPGILNALCQCTSNSIGKKKTQKSAPVGGKRKGPNLSKPIVSRTISAFIRKAKSRPGCVLVLKVRRLFQVISEVIKDCLDATVDYARIISELLPVVEYRLRMTKKTYEELLCAFLSKSKDYIVAIDSREDAFQTILALNALIQNPPGNLSSASRNDVMEAFGVIFPLLRGDQRIPKTCLSSLNAFLMNDGPNLGGLLLDIHSLVREFMLREWQTAKTLKEGFILYLRLQLKLRSIIVEDEGEILEELLGLVEKDLDNFGTKMKVHLPLFHLAASVIYAVIKEGFKPSSSIKRRRKEGLPALLKGQIVNGTPSWSGVVCVLVKYFGAGLPPDFMHDLLDCLVLNLERILTHCAECRSYEEPVWAIRVLQELSLKTEIRNNSSKDEKLWQSVWDTLVRWMPLCSSAPRGGNQPIPGFTTMEPVVLMEETLKLLGYLILKDLVPVRNAPIELWELYPFTRLPSRNAFFFIAMFFSNYGSQFEAKDLELRKTLSLWCLTTLSYEVVGAKNHLDKRPSPKLASAAYLALSVGFSGCCSLDDIVGELKNWWESDEGSAYQEAEIADLDQSEEHLASCGTQAEHEDFFKRKSLIGLSDSDTLLQVGAAAISSKVHEALQDGEDQLENIFYIGAVVSYSIRGVAASRRARGQTPQDWSTEGLIWKTLTGLLDFSLSVLEGFETRGEATRKQLSSLAVSMLQEFVSSGFGFGIELERLLTVTRKLFSTPSDVDSLKVKSNALNFDPELDAKESKLVHENYTNDKMELSFGGAVRSGQKRLVLSLISTIGVLVSTSAFDVLCNLLQTEHEIQKEVVLSMCKLANFSTTERLSSLVSILSEATDESLKSELGRYYILDAVFSVLSKLSREKMHRKECHMQILTDLTKILENVANNELMLWQTRRRLGEAIACLISVAPDLVQNLMDKYLDLVHDPDFRVRFLICGTVSILFETWNGHQGLFQDLCSNYGVELPMLASPDVKGTFTKTAMVSLGEVAAVSEQIEIQAVFFICSIAALQATQRSLAVAVSNRLAKRLGYHNRYEFFDQVMRGLLAKWVEAGISLVALVEIRDIFVEQSDVKSFLYSFSPFLMPHLLLHGRQTELDWMALVTLVTVSSLAKDSFASIFATFLPLYCSGSIEEKARAASVLQGSLITASGLTESERDTLIRRQMVAIVSHIFQLVTALDPPEAPYLSKSVAVAAVKKAVDGFTEIDQASQNEEVVDKMKVFRSDRVFQLLLQIHGQAGRACHARHRRHSIVRLGAVLDTIGSRVLDPSTFRYFVHITLQSMEMADLQSDCCSLICHLLEKLKNASSKQAFWGLGSQLQAIVSRIVHSYMVNCSTEVSTQKRDPSPDLIQALHRLVVEADTSLYPYIKELDPFPDVPSFEPMRDLHENLRVESSLADDFVQFVRRAPSLPAHLRLWSLQSFCNQLRKGKNELQFGNGGSWSCSDEMVIAIWRLVFLCKENDDHDMWNLTSEFLAAVGVGDPDAVVLPLPSSSFSKSTEPVSLDTALGVSEESVRGVLLHLCGYLLDANASVIEMACRTLRGVLSTEKGYRALHKLSTEEKAYLEIHTKGVNQKLVNDLLEIGRLESSTKAMSIEDPSLWSVNGKSYDFWICSVVHSLIECTDDAILRLCQGMVLMMSSVAEFLFPHVLGYLSGMLSTDSEIYRKLVQQAKDHILSNNTNTRSIQVFLEALNKLRVCHASAKLMLTSKKRTTAKNGKEKLTAVHTETSSTVAGILTWPKVYWIDVDYLITAKAAQQCAAYFTSVLYAEHWCEEKFGHLTLGDPDFCDANRLPDHVELLLNVYTKVNEPDGVYGIVHSHTPMSQLKIYVHEGNWGKVMEAYELLLQGGHRGSEGGEYFKGIAKALQQLGCRHLNEAYCRGITADTVELVNDQEFREIQYEAAWRSCRWDLTDSGSGISCASHKSVPLEFHGRLHSSLKCLLDGDSEMFQFHIKQMKEAVVSHVVHTSIESTQNVYPEIMKLQIVDSISQAWDTRWAASGRNISDDQAKKFITRWKDMMLRTRANYGLLEPFTTFLRVLFQALQWDAHLPAQFVRLAVLARKAGRLNHASVALQQLTDFCNKKSMDTSLDSTVAQNIIKYSRAGKIQEAKVLWAQGQQEMAVNLIKYLLSQTAESSLYCLAGKWIAETKSASSRVILESYFKKAADLAESGDKAKIMHRKSKTYFHLAHFASALYQSYEDRFNSSEWQAAVRMRYRKTKEFNAILKRLNAAKDDNKADYSMKAAEMQRQLVMDTDEVNRLKDDQEHYLHVALQSYRDCLLTSDRYDMRAVFRLVSLWFNLSSNQKVVESMLDSVQKIQSFKFLPLVYQIASRMGVPKDPRDFQGVVGFLVKKMAVDHPYHTLYQVIALANGDRIKDKQRSKKAFVVDPDKKNAAESLLKEITNHRRQLIVQVKQMVEMYIKLAELETPKDESKKLSIPRDVRSIRQLERVPVITAHLSIDPSCKYENSFPYFKGLTDKIIVMNGINAPKLIECMGSDGRKYRQLAKSGDDDLRQDAVMEQLFGLVNSLLYHHPETRKRCLRVRTYKVIPFTPCAGILEWVDGTVPLGDYLLGSSRDDGAHLRYGEGDWLFSKCRLYMVTEKDKSQAFRTVCENFRPVMRYFFLENFKQASEWFERRLAYTRSVAASSMVGYIIGLGDRHSNNILIDRTSAEVVHIDLGVAFEQGLMLKTPERVPFRLTRDIVNGMGVCGCEGVFRRCCEATLSVMRANKEALLTIVEVFIHDPLYRWALSPLKAEQLQNEEVGRRRRGRGRGKGGGVDDSEDDSSEGEDEIEGNQDAARAQMRVKEKLDGYEDGDMTSVQGQVQRLLQAAQDHDRLCQLFPGWAAWL